KRFLQAQNAAIQGNDLLDERPVMSDEVGPVVDNLAFDLGDHVRQAHGLPFQGAGIGSQADYAECVLILLRLDAGIEEEESDGVTAHIVGTRLRRLIAGAKGAFKGSLRAHDLCEKWSVGGKLFRLGRGNLVE